MPYRSPYPPGLFLPAGGPHHTDPPLAPTTSPTASYHLNHLMLRTTDPPATLNFYINLMGMRTVFAMNAGPFTMWYLGYPPPGVSSAEEIRAWAERVAHIPTLTGTLGLLEFYYMHPCLSPSFSGGEGGEGGGEDTPHAEEEEREGRISTGNNPPHLGFGHLGFTVPDAGAAVERLRAAGVTVVKEVGEKSKESVPVSDWEVERGLAVGELEGGFERIWEKIGCVVDPNGYMVELVPQSMEGVT
ncbi:lactoylglutathione lyase [Aspergillus ellipticus CBS 707.79]|uniref:Lactoylglutathione lyase n=1 Tax=Aspergillus ellipticus CBS 707.79 TaxID=1448320 RepID=A0A319DAK1_9EURO|nr:lactoylglutathione lyase [Aspergillus ellipticus CBS 707.79]